MLARGVETRVDSKPYSDICGLRVKYTGLLRERLHPLFPGLGGVRVFGIHNNSLNNGTRALVERVFMSPSDTGVMTPPPPCTVQPRFTLRGFKHAVLGHVGSHRPISKEKFLEYYKGRRLNVYQAAVDDLEISPLTEGDFGVKKAFVKAEKIDFTSKPDPAPRVIQPRDPRYNVEVGVYLRPLEHAIYKAIADVYGGPTVMKGYNAEGVACEMRAMWEEFRDPVAVGLDASRFDQHVRPEMLEWEHSVYTACFPQAERARLSWLLRGQIHNTCHMRTSDGTIKYKVKGSRMSGDMNTALGNCLIMCGLVHTRAKELGIHIRLGNNGDDCTVFMEKTDFARFSSGLGEWFLQYGFKMKIEKPCMCFEQVEFCQAHPVFDGETWVMVRNPFVTISKDACCVNKDYASGPAARKWLYAVGECGIAMTGGIPVCQAQYQAFLRNGEAGLGENAVVTETGMYYLSRGCTRTVREPTDSARLSFFLAFGLTPYEQRSLEQAFADVTFPVPDSPCIPEVQPLGHIPL